MRPAGRPAASSQQGRDPRPDGPHRQVSAANDFPPGRPYRVSARQLEDVAGSLTDLDREVLQLVARLRIVSGDQLRRALWWQGPKANAERRSRRALRRLATWRVVERVPGRTVGGVRAGSAGFLYRVGSVGGRLLARDGQQLRRLAAPGSRYVAHTLAIAELVVGLGEAERAGRLEVLGIETEPICWRRFTGPMGARLVLKPDLFVRIGVGSLEDRWLIEVDMASESPATIARKGRTYLAHYRSGVEQARHGVYPRVLWSVPDARRAEVVTRALSGLPSEAWRLFSVCTHSEVVARLAEEASS